MARHLLLLGVMGSGLLMIGAQLSKQRLHVEFSQQARDAQQEATVVSRQIDEEFQQAWGDAGLESAEPAGTLLVIRRLSLALTGSVPSIEELRALESIEEGERVSWWLQHLFEDRRFGDHLAERLARAVVGTEDGPFLVFRRRRFTAWLSDCIMENRPYDQIVRAMISDHGNWTHKPAVNFVTVTTGSTEEEQPDPERLAVRTARAFLGVRLDCVQCHDDNLGGDWLQQDFHQLAAFYSEARSFGLGLGIQDTPRDYEYTYLDADASEVVEPRVPFADALLETSEQPRRQQLAEWVTHRDNLAFSRATVNRFWAILFGRPLVDPVDDIPLEGPYPPGFELLAKDFAQHHDMRRLITQIAMTQVFQQQSKLPNGVTETDEEHWAVFPLVRLRPDQVVGSILQACTLSTLDSSTHILQRLATFEQTEQFMKRFGDQGEDEFTHRSATIPQRLLLFNGNLIRERTKDDLVVNAATRIAQQVSDNDRALTAAFLAVLTREPSDAERKHFEQLLNNDKLSRNHRLEDLFWTLLNSAEFSWNH